MSRDNPVKLLQDPQSLNLYAYARNNPLKYVDVDGRFAFLLTIPAEIIAQAALDAITIGLAEHYIANSPPLVPVTLDNTPPPVSKNEPKANTITTPKIEVKPKVQAKEKTDDGYLILYRGDVSGKNGFVAKGLMSPMNEIYNNGTDLEKMNQHVKDSAGSIFISTTARKEVANGYAVGKNGKRSGSVYTLRIPKDRAIPVQNSPDNEYLVPYIITGDKIMKEELVKK